MNQILLIDDEEAILTSIARFLKHLGYEVKLASNGVDGIEQFEKSDNLDLVITDIRMPIMNGNDVARKIRDSHKPETPIVAITGSKYVEQIEEELFNSVLIKPFKLETLVDTIRSLV